VRPTSTKPGAFDAVHHVAAWLRSAASALDRRRRVRRGVRLDLGDGRAAHVRDGVELRDARAGVDTVTMYRLLRRRGVPFGRGSIA